MRAFLRLIAAVTVIVSGGAVYVSSQTQDVLQKWNGSALADSGVYAIGGDVAIGTSAVYTGTGVRSLTIAAPSYPMVSLRSGGVQQGLLWATASDLRIETRPGAPITFWPGGNDAVRIFPSGDVGIGTTAPYSGTGVRALTINAAQYPSLALQTGGTNRGVVWATPSSLRLETVGSTPISFWPNGTQAMQIAVGGNVGIGTTTPAAKLHVAGNVTVDGNIAAKYQDVAEWVDAAEPIAPGTVVIIRKHARNGVEPSARAYDSAVAGVVSAQPGVVLGEPGKGRVLVAQSGRVRVKVDAAAGPIEPGDLLVTSDVTGFAMKSEPLSVGGASFHRPGTVLGKALEPLAAGKGQILVLITLQ